MPEDMAECYQRIAALSKRITAYHQRLQQDTLEPAEWARLRGEQGELIAERHALRVWASEEQGRIAAARRARREQDRVNRGRAVQEHQAQIEVRRSLVGPDALLLDLYVAFGKRLKDIPPKCRGAGHAEGGPRVSGRVGGVRLNRVLKYKTLSQQE